MIKNLRRSIAEGGKIKTGGQGRGYIDRSGKQRQAPEKWDHFKITRLERDAHGALIVDDAIMAALAQAGYADTDGRVRRLPIWLHGNTIDEVFPTALVYYSGRTCACRGDGERATRHEVVNGARTGKSKEIDCPCEYAEPDSKGHRRCKYSGILHASLRLPGHGVIGSVYKWRTTSQISCEQMVGHLEKVLLAAGTLRDIPLELFVRPVQVNPTGQTPKTVYVCHVDLCEQVLVAQKMALEAAQMRRNLAGGGLEGLEASYRETLQLPGAEPPEEQAHIADEYYPDEVVSSPSPSAVPAEPMSEDELARLRAPLAKPEPPPKPAAPPQEEPRKRTRRTTCKTCGELFGPGIVKNGHCTDCRAIIQACQQQQPLETPEPAPPPKPQASANGTGRDRIRADMRQVIQDKGVTAKQCMQALAEVIPDIYDENAGFSHSQADSAHEILWALEPEIV